MASAAICLMAALVPACGTGGHRAAAVVGRRGQAAATTTPAIGSSAHTSPGPIRPACQLVSREEVASVVGNPVTAGTGQGRNCSWGTDVDGGTSVFVTAVKPGPSGIAFECDSLREGQPREANHETVAGVGASATWVWQPLTTLTQASLVACWDDSAVMVMLTGERAVPALKASATNLAEGIHARS
jgi:hypothetical protein